MTKELAELDTRDITDAPRVLAMLFEGKQHWEIADALGMDRSCVTRKIHRLLDTREFQNALMGEWIKRYGEMKVKDAKEAFKHLTRLVSQGITRHLETTEDVRVTERRELVTLSIRNYEAETEAELNRVLQANRAREPVDSAPAASETS
jgi:hypothetical protein